jgi:hypothetical protein
MSEAVSESSARFRLAPGLAASDIDSIGVVIGGGLRTLWFRGPTQPLLALLRVLNEPRPLTSSEIAESIRSSTALEATTREALLGELPALLQHLLANGVIVRDTGAARGRRALTLVMRRAAEPIATALLSSQDVVLDIVHIAAAATALQDPFAGDPRVSYRQVAHLSALDHIVTTPAPNTTFIAVDLATHELHHFNRLALTHRLPWMFATSHERGTIISPLLLPGVMPCFACLRLRALGASEDPRPNAVLEAELMSAAGPAVASEPPVLEPAQQLLLAGTILWSLQWSDPSFSRINRGGEIVKFDIMAMPDCPECTPARRRPV